MTQSTTFTTFVVLGFSPETRENLWKIFKISET